MIEQSINHQSIIYKLLTLQASPFHSVKAMKQLIQSQKEIDCDCNEDLIRLDIDYFTKVIL